MSNAEKMVMVPPYIGLEPLVGLYYPAQCRSCGWVGSSEELTEDDAQCTRDVGDRLCLGDCDELDRDDLLNIIQAMAKAQQHQGEPAAYVLTPPGCSPALVFPRDIRNPSKYAQPLYTHADPAEVERLRTRLEEELSLHVGAELKHEKERDTLRAQLDERDHQLGLIGTCLGEILVAAKHIRAGVGLTGPQLLQFGEELRDCLSASAESSAPVEVEPVETTVFNDPLYNAESDARNASSLLEEVLEWFDDGVGRSQAEFKLMRKIGAWLGRSVPSVDGGSDECAHSYANGQGCPECGEAFEPEQSAKHQKHCLLLDPEEPETECNCAHRFMSLADHPRRCADCDAVEVIAPVERDERAEFEAKFPVPEGVAWDFEDERYYDNRYLDEGGGDYQPAWEAWQARAALGRKP